MIITPKLNDEVVRNVRVPLKKPDFGKYLKYESFKTCKTYCKTCKAISKLHGSSKIVRLRQKPRKLIITKLLTSREMFRAARRVMDFFIPIDLLTLQHTIF